MEEQFGFFNWITDSSHCRNTEHWYAMKPTYNGTDNYNFDCHSGKHVIRTCHKKPFQYRIVRTQTGRSFSRGIFFNLAVSLLYLCKCHPQPRRRCKRNMISANHHNGLSMLPWLPGSLWYLVDMRKRGKTQAFFFFFFFCRYCVWRYIVRKKQ